METICPFLDGEVAKELKRILKKEGIVFMESTKVTGATRTASGVTLNHDSASGPSKPAQLETEAVLVSVGRRPYTANCGLKEAGVEMDKRGAVVINSHFETSVKGIYGIGDVVNVGPMLAHKAEDEGIALAEILAGKAGHINYDTIPGVIYTHPEVAWVGKTEEECKKAGTKIKIGKFAYTANSRAKTNQDSDGFVKVITDAATDRVLGAHLIGSNAGEAIAEFVLAMEYGASAEDIGRTCHAHPTMSEAIKEACMAAFDKPIHA
jgi:dihydrolipoamide dehydrogenase